VRSQGRCARSGPNRGALAAAVERPPPPLRARRRPRSAALACCSQPQRPARQPPPPAPPPTSLISLSDSSVKGPGSTLGRSRSVTPWPAVPEPHLGQVAYCAAAGAAAGAGGGGGGSGARAGERGRRAPRAGRLRPGAAARRARTRSGGLGGQRRRAAPRLTRGAGDRGAAGPAWAAPAAARRAAATAAARSAAQWPARGVAAAPRVGGPASDAWRQPNAIRGPGGPIAGPRGQSGVAHPAGPPPAAPAAAWRRISGTLGLLAPPGSLLGRMSAGLAVKGPANSGRRRGGGWEGRLGRPDGRVDPSIAREWPEGRRGRGQGRPARPRDVRGTRQLSARALLAAPPGARSGARRAACGA
jgi:hypothetical protein